MKYYIYLIILMQTILCSKHNEIRVSANAGLANSTEFNFSSERSSGWLNTFQFGLGIEYSVGKNLFYTAGFNHFVSGSVTAEKYYSSDNNYVIYNTNHEFTNIVFQFQLMYQKELNDKFNLLLQGGIFLTYIYKYETIILTSSSRLLRDKNNDGLFNIGPILSTGLSYDINDNNIIELRISSQFGINALFLSGSGGRIPNYQLSNLFNLVYKYILPN